MAEERLQLLSSADTDDPPTLRNFVEYVETGDSRDRDPARRESSSTRIARRKLLRATGICVVFMIIEVIGGYLAGSLAIVSWF